ncbi:choice-of-anchor D domain-containing protein [Candidatus Albibeggiatoa sp. nov. BB20]|uniref:RCC1 domain-containing protein n=1 Tax=Candidatus Albibeggiatoa sp. nov. BB20 TaxID=3162723 RepID=UPI0033657D77
MLIRSRLKFLLIYQIFISVMFAIPTAQALTGISQLATGGYYTCGKNSTGVKCWGYNGTGQLGDDTSTDHLTPIDVSDLGSEVSAVALGEYHSCALLDTGTVKCWGFNGNGELGDGTTTDRYTPVDVSGLTGVSAIALGGAHACALLDTGTVKCWGINTDGELGDGTTTNSNIPVDVTGLTGVSAIALGPLTSCALLDTGTVKCWGNNGYGELGDGTTTDRYTPVAVSGLTGVSEISLGENHSCALLDTGSVKCWGYNGNGRLGDGTTTDSSTPIAVSSLTGVSAIALGNYHSCALLSTGSVKCWGYNGNGRLGDGTTIDQYTPTAVSSLTDASGLGLGKYHSCALLSTSGVKCWGFNENGQIGDGTTLERQTPVDVATIPEVNLVGNGNSIINGDVTPATSDDTDFATTPINTPVDKTFTIENSGDGNLTLSGDPEVTLTGTDCAMFSVTSQPSSPIASSASTNFTVRYNPTAATTHNCTVSIDNDDTNENPYDFAMTGIGEKLDQAITDFSLPATGVLDDSMTLSATGEDSTSSVTFASSTNSVCTINDGSSLNFISAGTCTVTADQAGDSNYNAAPQVSADITVYPALANVTQVSAGKYHTCTIVDGGIKCWGWNSSGQLGDTSTIDSFTPVDVSGLSSGVSAIALGDFHSCALLDTGGIKCWGSNGYGQLGDSSTTDSSTPVDVSGLSSGVSAIALGDYYSCALLNTGGIKCWGSNGYGQLGDGFTTDSSTPVDVTGLTSGVSTIALGFRHSCALLNTGGVKCWGYNVYGQLGDNSTTDSYIPIDVTGLSSGVSTIALGYYHSCALLDTGGVKCWGYNAYGQLGDSSTTSRYAAVDVTGLSSGVSAIALGYYHSCALLDTGSVKCWGENSNGQLGDNSIINRYTPIDVSSLNNVTDINLGYYHSCVLLDTGNVQCWGYNNHGQLGDNSTTTSYVPVLVKVLLPEINLVGNSNNISDGDTTPATSDDTDFGNTPINTPVDKTFTIENIDTGELTLLGSPIVALSGTGCTMFSVTSQPTSSIASSASANFTVQYNPTAAVTHNCTVSIDNTDADENPYDFAITGTGIAPEISLLGNGNAIVDGDTTPDATDDTKFGSTETNLPIDKTFTIENTGTNTLNLSGSPVVALSGTDCTMFSVTIQPTSPIAISSNDSFGIRYNPTVTGTHNCTVSIDNDDSDENPYDFVITGTAIAALAPSELTANTPSLDNIAQGVSLSWTDNSASEDEFILARNGSVLVTLPANSTSYIDTTATTCDRTYSYSLKAQHTSGESSSVSVTANMPECVLPPEPAPPNAPINFAANAVNYNQIELIWVDESSIETGYRVERNNTLIATLDENTETYTDNNLNCETTYNYEIYAYNSIGESEHLTATATTFTCPPNTPSQLSATVTADNITLSWEDVEGETSYLVTREAVTTRRLRAITEFDLAADSTTFTDSEFECGQSYDYAVAAVADSSASAAATITVDAEPCLIAPVAPSQLNIASITDTHISLTWLDNSDNETGFYVFNNGNVVQEIAENSASATIQNLQCETAYTFQVAAYNAEGQAYSESITATTAACPQVNLIAPSHFVATTLNNQVQLTWNDNSLNEAGFPIARNGKFMIVTPINAASFIDTNTTCGTEYIYHLYATDNVINVGGLEQIVTTPACLDEGEFYIYLNTVGAGIINNCNATACSLSATAGSTINLAATPSEGWQFSHWSGDCTSPQLVADVEKNCVAHFSQIIIEPESELEPEPIPQAIIINPLDPNIPTTTVSIPYIGADLCGASFSNYNSITGNLDICKTGSVAGGNLIGDNINAGLVSSFTLNEEATITGGRVSGFSTNQGTLQDLTITQYSEVTGGFYAGLVDNNGTMIDPYINEGSTIYSTTGQGTIQGITQNKGTIQGTIKLGVNTAIIGGTISGIISAPTRSPAYIGAAKILPGSTLQNVYLSPTVQLPRDVTLINVKQALNPAEPSLDDFGLNVVQLNDLDARTIVAIEPAAMALFDRYEIADIPTDAFAGMTPEQTATLGPETLSNVSVEQFEQLPAEALAGFTADNITALSPKVMQSLSPEQLEAFNIESLQQAELVAKLLTNIDSNTSQDIINKILPQGWKVTATGKIIPSVGSKLSFKSVVNRLPSTVSTPYLIDLQSSFSIGGDIIEGENVTEPTVGNDLNTGLQQTPTIDSVDLNQFIFTQNDHGIFNVAGTDDYKDIVFAFMPNANNIEQAPLDTPVGLTTVEGGYFQMVTPDKQEFVLINAPNNPLGLQQALGGESTIKLSPTGDVLMRIDTTKNNTRSRNLRFETDVMVVGMFDAFVEPAPDGFCADAEFCDFGMEFPSDFGHLRARQEARVIYPDGSAQSIYPTVIYPETLVNLLEQYESIRKVLYKSDGTFEVTVLTDKQEQQYSLTSNIDVKVRTLDAGEKRKPKINLQDNVLLYQVQEGDDLLSFSLNIDSL